MAKGKKEGTGGSVAKFMVAISHGKGVIGCEQYYGNVSGEFFYQFFQTHFPDWFKRSSNPKSRVVLLDGDPSQNSARAREALQIIDCKLFKIPACSPDLNPIENIFHSVGMKLHSDALENDLVQETFPQFSHRVKRTLLNFSVEQIDKTIESMPKRIAAVIKGKGERTNY